MVNSAGNLVFVAQINDQLTPRAGVVRPHMKCTAASAQKIAQQLDARWRYIGEPSKNIKILLTKGEAQVVTPQGPKTIPTWSDATRLVLTCPFSGEDFLFTNKPAGSRTVGAGRLPRAGLGGGGIPDFGTLIATEPSAASAWSQVQTQLVAEGGPNSVVIPVAQQHFYNAWTQLNDGFPGSNAQGIADISNAAMNLTLQNNSVAAAGSLVSSLVQGATSGNPVAVMQAFTGSLTAVVAADVAAGSISFGAGAAIMIGIELVGTWLDSLFSNGAPPVATVCEWNLNYQPTIVVNCAWSSDGTPIPPGYGIPGNSPQSNPFWRRFPELLNPTGPSDGLWYLATESVGNLADFTWTSGKSSDSWHASVPYSGKPARPIDSAFPQFHQLECDAAAAAPIAALPDGGGTLTITPPSVPPLPPPPPIIVDYSSDDVHLARFIMAYFGAWKANAEYALNGLQPKYADDAAVLVHLYALWQSAHQPGATRTITPRNNDIQAYENDVIVYPQPCGGSFSTEYWYISMLLNKAGAAGGLTINTGPKLNFGNVGTPGPGSSSSSTTSKLAYGVAAAAALIAAGIGVQAYRKHQSYGSVAKSAYSKTIGRAGRSVGHALSRVKARI